MTEKMQYAQFIQANIRRYGWQSFIVKITSIVVALTFLVSALVAPAALTLATGASLWAACGVVLVFLLWCGDGYSADMMDRYNSLYEKSLQGEEQHKMKLESKGLSVTAIWRPTVLAFHLPMMIMLILIGFAAK